MPLIMMVSCTSRDIRLSDPKNSKPGPGEAQALPCPRLRHLPPAPVRALKAKDMGPEQILAE